jgi:hypothetical protein
MPGDIPPEAREPSAAYLAVMRWPRWLRWGLMLSPFAAMLAVTPFIDPPTQAHRLEEFDPKLRLSRTLLEIHNDTYTDWREVAVHIEDYPCPVVPVLAGGHRITIELRNCGRFDPTRQIPRTLEVAALVGGQRQRIQHRP